MEENGTTVRSIGTRWYHIDSTNELSTHGNGPISENSGTRIIHFYGTGQFSDGRELSSNDTGIEVNGTEGNIIGTGQNSIGTGQNIIGTRQNIIGTGQNIIGTENSQVNRHAWVESWFHSQFIPQFNNSITNRQSSNGEGQPLLGSSGSSGNSGNSGNPQNSRNQNEESFSEDFDMNSWTYCYVMSAGFVFWFAVILLFIGLLYLVLIGLSKVCAWDS